MREQAAPKMCQPVFLLESYFLSMLQSGENDYGILQSGYYRSADSRCCHRRGPGVWGVVNLMEGYGNDNPGAKSQGMKQLMAK